MNTLKVNDYLASVKQKQDDGSLFSSPAMLFVNNSDQKFGEIYLFEKFGQAEANTYQMSSQITDHYMEDNIAREDHWAIAPDKYILSGFIGEVIYHPPKQWRNIAEKFIRNDLGPLSILANTFDSYTQSALNLVQAVEASFRRYEQIAQNIYKNIENVQTTRTNQKYIAQLLKTIQLSRQLVNVWTPYGIFKNIAIENVSLSQSDTKYKSRLEVELKQWRTISAQTREATEEEKKNYIARIQQAQVQDLGVAATQEVDKQTTLSKMLNIGDYRRE